MLTLSSLQLVTNSSFHMQLSTSGPQRESGHRAGDVSRRSGQSSADACYCIQRLVPLAIARRVRRRQRSSAVARVDSDAAAPAIFESGCRRESGCEWSQSRPHRASVRIGVREGAGNGGGGGGGKGDRARVGIYLRTNASGTLCGRRGIVYK